MLRKLGLIVMLALILVPGSVMGQDDAESGRIAVISAFNSELTKLLGEAEISEMVVINGHEFYVGTLRDNDVVMFLSGVSMVNAALTTTMALENFEISHIVFSGIAGGVSPDLHIGDVAVPMQWGNYGKGVYGRGSEAGDTFDFGWHELTFGSFGMFAPQTVTVFSEEAPMPEGESRFWFPVDDVMYAVAESLTEVELADCVETDDGEVCLEYTPVVMVGGSGVSAPIFVDNAEYRQWVWDTFGAVALDMETAAVAMVAYTYDVPYLAFRSLSDLAGGGPQENEINTFFQLAANNSAEVLLAFMESWAAQSK